MNKSIHNINLQAFQRQGSNQLPSKKPAYVLYNRYSAYSINPAALYATYFNTIPNVITLGVICCEKAQLWLVDAFKQDINDAYFTKRPMKQESKLEYDDVYYIIYNDILIYFDTKGNEALLLFRHTPMETIDRIVDGVKKFKRRVRIKPEISLVVNSSKGFDTREMEITRRRIDIENNYNDDFKTVHETIVKRLSKKNDNGIILLHGKPGTGKTTYIRHLISTIKKQVVFLPVQIAGELTSPTFMELLIDHPNSVFVIEDAENVVIDRNLQNGSPVAGILNLADGLLADCLNIQIICTFNTDLSKIDPALLRKGRLIARYEFTELTAHKAQRLSDELGFTSKITKPMALTDIFNQNEADFGVMRKMNAIGFKAG
ncbi:hypothetical protein GCM10011386_37090 [Parapedobacter defluvii]|uniref:ATPase AAA-type core domain-containing protein n=1 Tax=Parapedobacter defluvii TaxID=2045106 RepID=A0ABQ1MKX5_9SPHI|nr:AAA family ATPase [Parapedobacter defluvii]RQP15788.1 MAG: AAA family ATPase [Parapedobacter sp.]GGC41545.1 hypothetical protein GCM10011386_37090 [Parapedobacter defluvii]